MMQADIIIFGGGIAGLWTLATLIKQGYNAILLEGDALGAGQTIKSQGIIHAGLKYALSGSISDDVTNLIDMPYVWQTCINGSGAIDLSTSKILSPHQYLWSTNKLTGSLATLFTSNTVASYIEAAPKEEWPQIIMNSAIKTKLYKLAELVLDIPSVLRSIATPYIKHCIKIDSNDAYSLETDANNQIKSITIKVNNTHIKATAQKYIFTTGSNNNEFIKKLHTEVNMQLRPLHMVVVKSKSLLPIYGHCIELSTTPRMTITTHHAQDGTIVWYLGGKIAEDGAVRTTSEQIAHTKKELHAIFPNLALENAQYTTFFVNRAEAKQAGGTKPSKSTVFNHNNYIIAWPTKLALAPVLTEQIIQHLNTNNIKPIYAKSNDIISELPHPEFAIPVWDQ